MGTCIKEECDNRFVTIKVRLLVPIRQIITEKKIINQTVYENDIYLTFKTLKMNTTQCVLDI